MVRFFKKMLAVSLVAIVVIASPVHAQTEVLISDFETDLSSTLGPSWTAGAGATAQIVSGLGFEPQGSGMLEVTHTELWGSALPGMVLSGPEVAQAISESTALKLDIVAPQDFGWRQVFVIFQGSSLSWKQFGSFDATGSPEVATEVVLDLTQNVTDINSLVRPLNEVAADAFDEETDWWQMIFVFQGLDNLPLGTSITYLDNVRLIQNSAADADLDDDGDVDGRDFVLIQQSDPSLIPAWQAAFGNPLLDAGASISAVPEPSTAVLILMAACGGICRRRR